MRGVSIIGSTGSVGTQTLDVLSQFLGHFRVVGLAAGSNVALLAEQIRQFRPEVVSVSTPEAAASLVQLLRQGPPAARLPEVLYGANGLDSVAASPGSELLVNSVVGSVGLRPTLAAIAAGKQIALANKETLVAAGELVTKAARAKGVSILPIDSEHAAIFQCLSGEDPSRVRKLILTASGGPFLGRRDLSAVTRAEALKHPRWVMGAKITIDSATLMNKAFEMIEAHWLFGVPMDQIAVVIHPQSIVHSAVEFVDGNLIAQLGPTDMRLPIQYALTYPERLSGFVSGISLSQIGALTFSEPDCETFPSLNYAKQAVTMGGTMPAVMNAANEVAVGRFLSGEIPFTGIFRTVAHVLQQHVPEAARDLATVLGADSWARQAARSLDRW